MKPTFWWNKPVNPHVPVLLFLTVAIGNVIFALVRWPSHWPTLLFALSVGLFCWSGVEYVLHRFLFHVPLGNRPWDMVSRYMHWEHHAEPKNSDLVAASPFISIPVYLVSTWGVYVWGGAVWALGWGAGFSLGYATYERVHYAVHFNPVRGPVMVFLRQHHARHHFQDHHKRFGVSSPLWDWILGTL